MAEGSSVVVAVVVSVVAAGDRELVRARGTTGRPRDPVDVGGQGADDRDDPGLVVVAPTDLAERHGGDGTVLHDDARRIGQRLAEDEQQLGRPGRLDRLAVGGRGAVADLRYGRGGAWASPEQQEQRKPTSHEEATNAHLVSAR